MVISRTLMVTRAMAFSRHLSRTSQTCFVRLRLTSGAGTLGGVRGQLPWWRGEAGFDLRYGEGRRPSDPASSIVLATVAAVTSGPSPRPLRRQEQDVNFS